MHVPLQYPFNVRSLRVLKYLKLALGNGVEVSKSQNGFNVVAYCDSDWVKCPMTRRFVTSYYVFVSGCLVSCKSKKHATLPKTSAEVEYRALTSATCEIAANRVMHEKTKHFDINVHLVKEKEACGFIKTVKFDSKNQVAKILTKASGSV
ncbi:ribonuclease H-like domain-containing protein [Tanacetum coccineum]